MFSMCALATACALANACSIDLAPLEYPATGGSAGSGTGGFSGSAGSGLGGGVGGSGFGGSGAGGSGAGGSSGFVGSPTCDGYCDKAMAAGCGGVTKQMCLDYCNGHFDWFARCAAQYEYFISCGKAIGTFNCTNGTYEQTNCFEEWGEFVDCTFAFTPMCTLPPPSSLGEACYGSTNCNPMINDCPAGTACNFSGSGQYDCYQGLYNQVLCGDCTATGCQGGLECVGNNFSVCARYCCSDSDCGGAPGSCIEVGYFTGTRFCGVF